MRLLRTDGDEVIIALTEEELMAIERALCTPEFIRKGGGEEVAVYDGLLDIMREIGR